MTANSELSGPFYKNSGFKRKERLDLVKALIKLMSFNVNI